MDRIAFAVTAAVMFTLAAVVGRTMPDGHGFIHAAGTLEHAASSPGELIDRLLAALEDRDLEAMRRLRVTEAEYKRIILPRTMRPEVADFAWGTLNTKSLYYERHLLEQLGGRRYRAGEPFFDKGTKEYAGYRALRQIRVGLTPVGEDANDAATAADPKRLETGSIADVGGRYKFISFVRD
jgi:hypothetical protein